MVSLYKISVAFLCVKLVSHVHVQHLQTNVRLCFQKATLLFHTATLAFLDIIVT